MEQNSLCDIHGFTPLTAAAWDPDRPENSSSRALFPALPVQLWGRKQCCSVWGDQRGQMPTLSLLAFAEPWRALGKGGLAQCPVGSPAFSFTYPMPLPDLSSVVFAFSQGYCLSPGVPFQRAEPREVQWGGCSTCSLCVVQDGLSSEVGSASAL